MLDNVAFFVLEANLVLKLRISNPYSDTQIVQTRTNDISRSLSGFREAELLLIQSPPPPILSRPQDDIDFGSTFSMICRDIPWVKTSE
jgi:hypothetical protein